MSKGTQRPPSFIGKTYAIISDPATDHLVAWDHDGETFCVRNPERLAQDVFPSVFSHASYPSFTRALNAYGFRQVARNKWKHPDFRRGGVSLLDSIQRRRKPSKRPAGGPTAGGGAGASGEAQAPVQLELLGFNAAGCMALIESQRRTLTELQADIASLKGELRSARSEEIQLQSTVTGVLSVLVNEYGRAAIENALGGPLESFMQYASAEGMHMAAREWLQARQRQQPRITYQHGDGGDDEAAAAAGAGAGASAGEGSGGERGVSAGRVGRQQGAGAAVGGSSARPSPFCGSGSGGLHQQGSAAGSALGGSSGGGGGPPLVGDLVSLLESMGMSMAALKAGAPTAAAGAGAGAGAGLGGVGAQGGGLGGVAGAQGGGGIGRAGSAGPTGGGGGGNGNGGEGGSGPGARPLARSLSRFEEIVGDGGTAAGDSGLPAAPNGFSQPPLPPLGDAAAADVVMAEGDIDWPLSPPPSPMHTGLASAASAADKCAGGVPLCATPAPSSAVAARAQSPSPRARQLAALADADANWTQPALLVDWLLSALATPAGELATAPGCDLDSMPTANAAPSPRRSNSGAGGALLDPSWPDLVFEELPTGQPAPPPAGGTAAGTGSAQPAQPAEAPPGRLSGAASAEGGISGSPQRSPTAADGSASLLSSLSLDH